MYKGMNEDLQKRERWANHKENTKLLNGQIKGKKRIPL